MEMTFINVGYGDAILIRAQGFTLLLDGGSALPEEFAGFEYRIPAADFLHAARVSRIDLLLISHIHEDHVCGLEDILDQIPVGEIRLPFAPELFKDSGEVAPDVSAPRSTHLFSQALNALGRILRRAEARGVPVKVLRCGQRLDLPGGSHLSILGPKKETCLQFEYLLQKVYTLADPTQALTEMDRTSNAASLLMTLSHGNIECLLAADSVPSNWAESDFPLLKNENVLKLPHHGQIDSFDASIMKDMPLKYVVTTASSDRRYNSANPRVYEALRELHPDVEFLFTDEREYPPFFSRPDGFQAIKLVMDSGEIRPEFIKINKKENTR